MALLGRTPPGRRCSPVRCVLAELPVKPAREGGQARKPEQLSRFGQRAALEPDVTLGQLDTDFVQHIGKSQAARRETAVDRPPVKAKLSCHRRAGTAARRKQGEQKLANGRINSHCRLLNDPIEILVDQACHCWVGRRDAGVQLAFVQNDPSKLFSNRIGVLKKERWIVRPTGAGCENRSQESAPSRFVRVRHSPRRRQPPGRDAAEDRLGGDSEARSEDRGGRRAGAGAVQLRAWL